MTWVSKKTLFEEADILTIHLVLSERSHGLVDAEPLGWMKPGARLVNTARGPIVDEPALVQALQSGRLAGAALDVYGEEPLPSDHPFRQLPKCTGHASCGLCERAELPAVLWADD